MRARNSTWYVGERVDVLQIVVGDQHCVRVIEDQRMQCVDLARLIEAPLGRGPLNSSLWSQKGVK